MSGTTLTSGTLKLAPYSSHITPIPGSTNYDVTSTPLISATILGADFFDTFNAMVNITTMPGTVTSADVYIQGLAPDGTTWYDLYHFTQFVATGNKVYSFRPAGCWEFTVQDAALAAQSTNTVNLPRQMRIKIVFAGTGNIQMAVDMEFFRRRGIGGT